jgi:D-3-phosphoglycerate dehydrogenase
MDFVGRGLTGRTLASLGLGNIGGELFRLAAPLGMRHLAHDPAPATAAHAAALGVALVDFDTLFREADFLVVNCPLNPATRGLVGARALGLMKKEAFLVNCARGPIVDEAALTAALRDGRLAGAGLDVFEREPTPADNPILALDNVMVSPHGIAYTDESLRLLAEGAFRAAVAFAERRVPPHVVNPAALEHEALRRWFAGAGP